MPVHTGRVRVKNLVLTGGAAPLGRAILWVSDSRVHARGPNSHQTPYLLFG